MMEAVSEQRLKWPQRLASAVAFAVLCGTLGVAAYQHGAAREAVAPARVLRNVAHPSESGTQYAALVAYRTPDGALKQAELSPEWTPAYEPGESLRVRYRRDDSGSVRADSLLKRLGLPVAAGVAAVLGSIFLLIRRR